MCGLLPNIDAAEGRCTLAAILARRDLNSSSDSDLHNDVCGMLHRDRPGRGSAVLIAIDGKYKTEQLLFGRILLITSLSLIVGYLSKITVAPSDAAA